MKNIVYGNGSGGVVVITPTLEWLAAIMAAVIDENKTEAEKELIALEELAKKDVPLMDAADPESPQIPYRIIDSNQLPVSRNWRNAWTDGNDTETVDVDLQKAKTAHIDLMVRVANNRVPANRFGQRDFKTVAAEIEVLEQQVKGINDLNTLYNAWPASIEQRSGQRVYQMHDLEAGTV